MAETDPVLAQRIAVVQAALATLPALHARDRGIGWEIHTGAGSGACWTGADAACGDTITDGFRDTMDRTIAEGLVAIRTHVPALVEALNEMQRKLEQLQRELP